MKIEVGKHYKSGDTDYYIEARLKNNNLADFPYIATCKSGYITFVSEDGRRHGLGSKYDLKPYMVKQEGWIRIFPRERATSGKIKCGASDVYKSEEYALADCPSQTVLRIEWEEEA